MIKRGILNKVAVFTLAAGMTVSTLGVTTAFAKDSKVAQNEVNEDNNSWKANYDVYSLKTSIKSLKVSGNDEYDKETISELEAELKRAIGEVSIEVGVSESIYPIVAVHIPAKQLKFNGKDSYISSLENITKKQGSDSCGHVEYKAKKQKDGSSVFSYRYDFEVEETTNSFVIGIKNLAAVSGDASSNDEAIFEVNIEFTEPVRTDLETSNNNDANNDNSKVNNVVNNAQQNNTVNDDKAKDEAKKVVEQKQAEKNDKSPKTSDEMSTGVMIALGVGSLSLVSLAGFYILKSRKE